MEGLIPLIIIEKLDRVVRAITQTIDRLMTDEDWTKIDEVIEHLDVTPHIGDMLDEIDFHGNTPGAAPTATALPTVDGMKDVVSKGAIAKEKLRRLSLAITTAELSKLTMEVANHKQQGWVPKARDTRDAATQKSAVTPDPEHITQDGEVSSEVSAQPYAATQTSIVPPPSEHTTQVTPHHVLPPEVSAQQDAATQTSAVTPPPEHITQNRAPV